ncbi:hypothetical protein EDD90_1869 [Streptomyces sp. Ag109_O5-1]|uniref:hypothetical protein n=1 Tax=Streptomyces sp. Ag109_O5-1 TaxID=1938851 RepID=UPI000F4EE8D3|nr:hypothetical protein [Streptomyces sp. Ag109_O5-1]RPE38925.1 hypothetical protein EDD90_1869 [Streptomyces sp. Ag109_O5-1]
MLDQALAALAAAGGTAVVQAAGTDVWTALRQAVARWFGRGDEQRERAVLERLDQAARELQTAGAAEAEGVRILQEAVWQARIEALLESLGEAERVGAAEELRALLAQHNHYGGVSVGDGGQAVVGDVKIHADHGSAAAWSMGNVTLGNPPQPGPHEG